MTPGRRRSAGLALAGLGFLALGVLVYLTDRPPLPALPTVHVPGLSGAGWFGPAADWLPALAHTAGFGLLGAAALPPRGPWAALACVFWGLVNVLAEFGQLPRVDHVVADAVHGTLGDGRVAGLLARYFTYGIFDVKDVAAALAGMVIALLVTRAWRLPGAGDRSTRRRG